MGREERESRRSREDREGRLSREGRMSREGRRSREGRMSREGRESRERKEAKEARAGVQIQDPDSETNNYKVWCIFIKIIWQGYSLNALRYIACPNDFF